MIQAEEALKKGGEKEVEGGTSGEAAQSTARTEGLERAGLVAELWGSPTKTRQHGVNSQGDAVCREEHFALSFRGELNVFARSPVLAQFPRKADGWC